MIKISKKQLIEVRDWDNLVRETYKKIYEFQQQDGCKERGVEYITIPSEPEDYENTTIPEIINGEEMGVSFQTWLERDIETPLNPTKEELENSSYYWGKSEADEIKYKNDKHHISLFWERNFYPHVTMIANDLYAKGLLEAGEYVINIDW